MQDRRQARCGRAQCRRRRGRGLRGSARGRAAPRHGDELLRRARADARAAADVPRAAGGRILIVSSESAFAGQPANSIYCASKWAIEGWAESLAFEVSPFGIDVVLVEPGPYVTDIWESSPRISPEGSAYRAWVQYMFRAGDAHVAARGRDPDRGGKEHRRGSRGAPSASFRNPVGRMAKISPLRARQAAEPASCAGCRALSRPQSRPPLNSDAPRVLKDLADCRNPRPILCEHTVASR